jgi:hypothetical protein
MTPAAFADHFGVPSPDVAASARLAALRLISTDLNAAETSLSSGGIAPVRRMDRLIVPAKQALGATLVFEAAH